MNGQNIPVHARNHRVLSCAAAERWRAGMDPWGTWAAPRYLKVPLQRLYRASTGGVDAVLVGVFVIVPVGQCASYTARSVSIRSRRSLPTALAL